MDCLERTLYYCEFYRCRYIYLRFRREHKLCSVSKIDKLRTYLFNNAMKIEGSGAEGLGETYEKVMTELR